MDKTTKSILIIVGSVLVLCACTTAAIFATGLWSFARFANWTDETVSERPQVAIRVGSEIADYVIPVGFDSPYSVHFGEVTMVGYTSQSGRSHILLAQFPAGNSIDLDEMLRQISEGAGDPHSSWYNTETNLIEEKPVTIRGEETVLSIGEGTSSDGIPFRMATATFEGRSGPALVMVAGPLEEWDMETVESFIASIQ